MPSKRAERPTKTLEKAETALVKSEGALRQIVNEANSIADVAAALARAGITRENVKEAGELSQALVRVRKAIKEHHQPIHAAIREAGKKAREQENLYLRPVEEAEGLMVEALAKFRIADRQRLDEEQRRVVVEEPVREVSSGGDILDMLDDSPVLATTAPLAIVQRGPEKVAGVGFRDTWGWEMLDASKVREEFWVRTLNERAITDLVESLGPAAAYTVGEGAIKVVPKSIPIRRG